LNLDFNEIQHCIPIRNNATSQPAKTEPVPKPTELPKQSTKPDHPQTEFCSPAHAITNYDSSCAESCITWETCKNIQEEHQQKQVTPAKTPTQEATKIDLTGVPKPLADLMNANSVTVQEIQQVVSSRGYYPEGTPISNYDPNFISGVLVGAWTQVFEMIKAFKNDIPF